MMDNKASAFTSLEPVTGTRKRKLSSPEEGSNQEKDNNCSYTAMIAQAIMKTPYKRATLSEIYNFMANAFEILKKRGNGWRNCVRHTLSLNECFVKLNRPENGRSCNWTVHPSYFEAFMRGDYRKRRSNRKKIRDTQPWGLAENRCLNYNNQQSAVTGGMSSYMTPSSLPQDLVNGHHNGVGGMRPNDMVERMNQQTSSPPLAPSTHSMWHSYVSSLENNAPSKTPNPQDFATYAAAYHHSMYGGSGSGNHEIPQHKHLPTTNAVSSTLSHSPMPSQNFHVPGYGSTSTSPPGEFNEHLSPSNSIESPHANRMRYNNRSYSNPGFPPPFKGGGSGGERISYEANGSERVNYDRSSAGYAPHDVMAAQHFQLDSAACYGNLTNRSYRTEYF